MSLIRGFSDGLGKFLEILIVVLFLIMTVFMSAQVLGRYVFKSGLFWAEELSRFSMVFMVYAGAALACRHHDHISVTIIEEFLKGTALRIYRVFIALIMLAFLALVTVVGFQSLAFVANQTSPNMGVSMNFIYAIIPVCAVVMALYEIIGIILIFDKPEEKKA